MACCSLAFLGACAEPEIVTLGHYEQDGNAENGPEAIEWIVLKNSADGKMMISKYGLAAQPYNTKKEEIHWEDCSLRAWLNNEFLNEAFTADEQAKILEQTIVNNEENDYFILSGADTKDKVFLLSTKEADTLFADRFERQMEVTAAAAANGAYVDGNGFGSWWLRTTGRWTTNAALVGYFGSIDANGQHVDFNDTDNKKAISVRPVIWLKK